MISQRPVEFKKAKSPLHFAAYHGSTDNCQNLFEAGAGVNTCYENTGMTPLHAAASSPGCITTTAKRFAMCKLLLEEWGADATAMCETGATPLHVAAGCFDGAVELCLLLLENGAIINVNTRDKQGRTPLHAAAESRSPVNNVVPVTARLLCDGSKVNAKDTYGCTPLHLAASIGQTSVCELLIRNGADINAKDNFGRTPLEVAYTPNEDIELIEMLSGRVDQARLRYVARNMRNT